MAEDDADVAEPSIMIDNSKFEMVNSKYAMTTICNVLMNLTVLEPKFVQDTPIFFHILKFIMNSLPTLENEDELLVLYGNLSVLGLLILKNHSRRPKPTDFSLCKFVQAVVRYVSRVAKNKCIKEKQSTKDKGLAKKFECQQCNLCNK